MEYFIVGLVLVVVAPIAAVYAYNAGVRKAKKMREESISRLSNDHGKAIQNVSDFDMSEEAEYLKKILPVKKKGWQPVPVHPNEYQDQNKKALEHQIENLKSLQLEQQRLLKGLQSRRILLEFPEAKMYSQDLEQEVYYDEELAKWIDRKS